MQSRLATPGHHRLLLVLLPLAFVSLVLAACGGDDEPPDATATLSGAIATATLRPETTPTQTAGATATLTARPAVSETPSPGAVVDYTGYNILGDFTYGAPIDFPANVLMLVETGCTQCDSGPDALYRVWRNDGETHVELLVDAAISGVDGAYITSLAVRPSLHDIVVTVCTECAHGPLTSSSVTVYRSIDGGVTWQALLETDPGEVVYARAVTAEGIVLEKFGGGLSYLRGDAIEPPEGAEGLLHDSNRAGELRWLAQDGSTVLDAEGTAIAVVEQGSLVDAVVTDRLDARQTVVGWGLDRVRGPFDGWVVTRAGPDGRLTGFRFDTYVAPVTVLDDGAILGTMSTQDSPYGGTIGFIDVSTGVLTAVHGVLIEPPFGDGARTMGRNVPLGAVSGPFLRVTTGINCLPIRASTGLRSRELTCAADGTLVYDLHNTTTVGGQQWTRVRLLDGREGFAVSSYLTLE